MKQIANRYLPVAITVFLLVVSGYLATSKGFLAPATVSVVGVTGSVEGRTATERPEVTVKMDIAGAIAIRDIDSDIPFYSDPSQVGIGEHKVTLSKELKAGKNSYYAIVTDVNSNQFQSPTAEIILDKVGPKVSSITSIDGKKLEVQFADVDVKKDTIVDGNLIIKQKTAGSSVSLGSAVPYTRKDTESAGLFRLEFSKQQPPGDYVCEVTAALTDKLGNAATAAAEAVRFRIPFTTEDASASRLTPVEAVGSGLSKPTPTTGQYWIANKATFDIDVTGIPATDGTLTAFVDNMRQSSNDKSNSRVSVTLLHQGINTVEIVFQQSSQTNSISLGTIQIVFDDRGPVLNHAELVERPTSTGMGTTLQMTFDDMDFGAVQKTHFEIRRQTTGGGFETGIVSDSEDPIVNGRTVQLPLGTLVAGEYQLAVKGSGTTPLRDKAGNPAGQGRDQFWVFSSLAGRKFGRHVEFPPFAAPKKQDIPKEGFNPGDFVETRVARLYYYRDAHRVAEIINRNVRSYNQAAVTQAERRAEKSRDDANDAVDERRKAEREAVQAAEQARTKEQQLADAREALATTQGLKRDIDGNAAEEAELSRQLGIAGIDPETRTALNKRLEEVKKSTAQNQQNLARMGGTSAIDSLTKNVAALEQTVATLRQTELVKQESTATAETKEARTKAKQFRDEVSAAETDPDTYVAGDLGSVDPVTQVSISVIGEGLIQLRGPIKGVNKIRTMINEIDSPVGQIKIGIFSVQVNGEKGDKMEKVVGNAEGNVDLSRFLVNQSLNLLRRSIQTEAAAISDQCAMEGHYQVDRDRRYLYLFFGRDFIDELYAMNSEFLNTENKLLSLHSMDTVSLNRALFILALAKNDVRERVVSRFLEATKTELADAEFDFRRSSELKPHKTEKRFPPWNRTHLPVSNHYTKEDVIFEAVHRNAQQRYHFRNFSSFFDTGFTNTDTMNPMQRQFVRLAQIFKARLVAEMELKQRVLERGLIEDRSNDEDDIRNAMKDSHDAAIRRMGELYWKLATADETIAKGLQDVSTGMSNLENDFNNVLVTLDKLQQEYRSTSTNAAKLKYTGEEAIKVGGDFLASENVRRWLARMDSKNLETSRERLSDLRETLSKFPSDHGVDVKTTETLRSKINELVTALKAATLLRVQKWQEVIRQLQPLQFNNLDSSTKLKLAAHQVESVVKLLESDVFEGSQAASEIARTLASLHLALESEDLIKRAEQMVQKTRGNLDHRKLLNHLIDEQEDKFIELVEGVRSHTAIMDDYLKRLSIAIEDDFKVQFYDPAFVRVRDAARACQVNLGQVERTTILTNNRAFAKVDPQATMEFDLPKRQIAIKEAFDAAKALVEDSGALMNDPTFLSAFQMMGGSKQPTTVKNMLPGQSQSLDQHVMGIAPQPQDSGAPGAALQSLVPEPSVFKLETGTGFQIRPMMQPDGDSVVYDFDYMYSTNIREPVRADEKHIGRIKRHFVHTAVQTGNFEIREISRYQVALKVSRTSQGVPLLQDIPVVGAAFRPAPSAESSIQQNIIFGQTNVYPTLFDLMGLRWAQQVVDLDHTSLMESEHVIRGRQKSIRDYVFGESSRRVDEFLDISTKAHQNYRPDLYYPQSLPSPYHPNGHRYPNAVPDPTGNNYERQDIRPADMQEPPYERYRHQPASPERIMPQYVPESIRMNSLEPIRLPGVIPLGSAQTQTFGTNNQRIGSPNEEVIRLGDQGNWNSELQQSSRATVPPKRSNSLR